MENLKLSVLTVEAVDAEPSPFSSKGTNILWTLQAYPLPIWNYGWEYGSASVSSETPFKVNMNYFLPIFQKNIFFVFN